MPEPLQQTEKEEANGGVHFQFVIGGQITKITEKTYQIILRGKRPAENRPLCFLCNEPEN